MSYIETETVISSADVNETKGTITHRKTARIAESFHTKDNRPRRVCRRHSFAFRCTERELDEFENEGKHFESILLVKVSVPRECG